MKQAMQENPYEAPDWFPLDVAATIYPFSRTRTWSNTYRFAFVLKEDVNPELLRQAVKDIYPRFPSFFVSLRSGLFWYFLERSDNTDIVFEEDYYPCRAHSIFDTNRPAVRVLYYKRRISIEVFHGVTDGGATLLIFQALLARYLELKGISIAKDSPLPRAQDGPKPAEMVDCYRKEYTREKLPPVKGGASYQFKAKKKPNYFKVIHGLVPIEDLKTQAKSRGLTITDYLLAVFLYALYVNAPRPYKKPIIISVPVGLRAIYSSESLRNFSLFSNIGFDPAAKESFSFDDIAKAVKGKLDQGKSKEVIHSLLNQNVKIANAPLFRILPNFMKLGLGKVSVKLVGDNRFASSLTNLGAVNLPEPMSEYVERAEVLLGEKPEKRVACALISYNNFMNITMTGNTKEVMVQRAFYRLLAEHGARVRIECNDDEAGGFTV